MCAQYIVGTEQMPALNVLTASSLFIGSSPPLILFPCEALAPQFKSVLLSSMAAVSQR